MVGGVAYKEKGFANFFEDFVRRLVFVGMNDILFGVVKLVVFGRSVRHNRTTNISDAVLDIMVVFVFFINFCW